MSPESAATKAQSPNEQEMVVYSADTFVAKIDSFLGNALIICLGLLPILIFLIPPLNRSDVVSNPLIIVIRFVSLIMLCLTVPFMWKGKGGTCRLDKQKVTLLKKNGESASLRWEEIERIRWRGYVIEFVGKGLSIPVPSRPIFLSELKWKTFEDFARLHLQERFDLSMKKVPVLKEPIRKKLIRFPLLFLIVGLWFSSVLWLVYEGQKYSSIGAAILILILSGLGVYCIYKIDLSKHYKINPIWRTPLSAHQPMANPKSGQDPL